MGMPAEDPAIAIARATREQRGMWAGIISALAAVAALVGYILYYESRPSLDDSARNVAVAMARLDCADGTTTCGGSYIESQPIYLYIGGSVAGVLLLIAFLLMVTRPALPRAPRSTAPAIIGAPDD